MGCLTGQELSGGFHLLNRAVLPPLPGGISASADVRNITLLFDTEIPARPVVHFRLAEAKYMLFFSHKCSVGDSDESEMLCFTAD